MEYFLPFVTIAAITALMVPITIKLANKYHLVDDPSKRPHPAHAHQRIIPRAGGLSIYVGIVCGILLFLPIEKHILGILLSISILLVMGLLDDRWVNFSPYQRLGLQFLAALVAVGSGIGITYTTNPLGGILRLDEIVYHINLFGQHNIVLIADLVALIWIVAIMNIVNWSKGVDGQMPGIIFVAGLTIGIVAGKLGLAGDPNQTNLAILAIITSAAAFGFLLFNWYPSKILPGFSGSTILGFMIAVLSILSSAKLATALMVLLVPIVDAIFTAWRRILSGKSPVWADQGHLHHRLLALGWSHQQISLFYITSGTILGLLATNLNSFGKFVSVLIIGTITLGIIGFLQITLKKKT